MVTMDGDYEGTGTILLNGTLQTSGGISPVSWLEDKPNSCKFVRFTNQRGISPVS